MLRTKVPNDIRKYKTKLAGPFTLKQLITVTGLIILDLAVYSFVQPFNLSAEMLCTIILGIDLCIGGIFLAEVNERPAYSFFLEYLKYNVFAPRQRRVSLPVEKKYPVKVNVDIGKVTISCTNQTGDAKEEIKKMYDDEIVKLQEIASYRKIVHKLLASN